jgi:putative inorganic carbon (hco3(-)) transporter
MDNGKGKLKQSGFIKFSIAFFLFVSVCILILILQDLSFKYSLATMVVSIVIFVFIASKNKSKLLFVAITISLPFAGADVFLGEQPKQIHYGGAQSIPEINIVDILLFCALGWEIFQKLRDIPPIIYPKLPIVAWFSFVIWSGFSIILSQHHLLGLVSFYELIKISILFLYMFFMIKTERMLEFTCFLLIIGLCVQALLGIYQHRFGFPMWMASIAGGDTTYEETVGNTIMLRIGGTIGWSTVFAQYLELLIPLALSLFIVGERLTRRYFYAGTCLLAVISLVLTLSRAGVASTVIGVSLTMVILFFIGKDRIRKRVVLAFVSFALLSLCFMPLITMRTLTDDHGSAANRIPMFQVAYNIIRQNPVLGTGLNSYSEVMHNYDPQRLISDFKYPVHNVYLYVAGEVGLPGLFFLILFFAGIFIGLKRALKNKALRVASISAGLMGGMVAFLLHGMVEQSFKGDVQLWYVFSAALGIAMATARLSEMSLTSKSIPSIK